MDKHKDNGILLVPGDVLKCEKKENNVKISAMKHSCFSSNMDSRSSAELEAEAVFLDFPPRRQSQFHAARLHVVVIQVHHADRALMNADGADENKDHRQSNALQKYLTNHFRFSTISAP